MLQNKGVGGGCRGDAGVQDSVDEVDKEGVREQGGFGVVQLPGMEI